MALCYDRLSKGEDVNTSILVKICNALECGIRDIVDSVLQVSRQPLQVMPQCPLQVKRLPCLVR